MSTNGLLMITAPLPGNPPAGASHIGLSSATIWNMTIDDRVNAQRRLLRHNLERALAVGTPEAWATLRSTIEQLRWFEARARRTDGVR